MHATEYLNAPDKHPTGPIAVLSGSVRQLKTMALSALRTQVLGEGEDRDLGFFRLEGPDIELRDVTDELTMVSMFGESKVVVVEDAQEFVSKNRAGLEAYLDHPSSRGVLVLDVNSWPKNTKLAKRSAKVGLTLECTELKGAQLRNWVVNQANTEYEKQISPPVASLMIELAGTDLGLLKQELAKLASFAGDRPEITQEDVRNLVGGWKTDTTWVMLDAIRDGKLDVALANLDKLLVAGEPPLKLLGGITFVYRKLAVATELSRQKVPLSSALKQAGVFPNAIGAMQAYMRRIGRPRAERIYEYLQAADMDLKGRSALPDRVILERLFVQLSGLAPA